MEPDAIQAVVIGLMKLSPVVAILIFGIRYFFNKEKDYQKEIKELNSEIREIEKGNLEIINKLADAIDNLSDSNENVHKEISNLKKMIQEKIDRYNEK